MITLYYTRSSASNKRAIEWFQSQDIMVFKKRSNEFSREDLHQILFLSEEGFSDILKKKSNTGREIKKKLEYIDYLAFNEAIDYIITHPEVLRFPIIFDDKRLLVGFHEEEIRQFVERTYRNSSRYEKCNKKCR